jgi:hypothetical protein
VASEARRRALTRVAAGSGGVVGVAIIRAIDLMLTHDKKFFDKADRLGGDLCEQNAPCLHCDKRFGDTRVPQIVMAVADHFAVGICKTCAKFTEEQHLARLNAVLGTSVTVVPSAGDARPR